MRTMGTTTMSKKISHFHTVQSKHPSRNCIGFDLLQYGAHTHLPPIICSSMKVFIFFLLNAHKPPLYDIPSVCHIGVRLSWERRTGAQSQFDATERERDEVDITCCLFFGLYKFFIIILVYAFGCIFFFIDLYVIRCILFRSHGYQKSNFRFSFGEILLFSFVF